MQKHTTWLAAAALALGGVVGVNGNAWAQDAGDRTERAADRAGDRMERGAEKTGDALNRAADRTGEALNRGADRTAEAAGDMTRDASATAGGSRRLPAGVNLKTNEGEANDIREAVEEVTEAALTKDGFDNLVRRLVDSDEDRINQWKDRNLDAHNGRIEQIRKAWKQKYGKDFDMSNDQKKVVFNGPILHGEVADPAQVVGRFPLPATSQMGGGAMGDGATGGMGGEARPAGDREEAAERKNLEKGQDIAILTVPRGHGLPELTVSLIQETAWHVDIPDRVAGQQLLDNLGKHLIHVGESVDKWPQQEEEAYRMVAHHVLAALYGVDAKSADAGGMGDRSR